MKLTTPLLSTLLLLPYLTFAEDTFNSVHQYGLTNFNQFFVGDRHDKINQDLATRPNFYNYTYYFDAVTLDNSPFKLTPHLNRTSWIKTNVLESVFGLINVSGQYYFNNGYDVEYNFIQDVRGDVYSTATNSSVLVNFPTTNHWQFGVGIQNSLQKIYPYEWVENSWERSDDSEWVLGSALLFQSRFINLTDGQGWNITNQLNYDVENESGRISLTADYYSSKDFSTTVYLSYLSEKYEVKSLKNVTVGVSQKYWYSKNTAIGYGIAVNYEMSERLYDNKIYDDSDNIVTFELNFTKRL